MSISDDFKSISSVRISLTPEDGEFDIFIFDGGDINGNDVGKIGIFNGTLEFSNNELINYIEKTSDNELVFKKDGILFIVVKFREYPELLSSDNDLRKPYTKSYILGVTNDKIPLNIKEGIPSKVNLNIDYQCQS